LSMSWTWPASTPDSEPADSDVKITQNGEEHSTTKQNGWSWTVTAKGDDGESKESDNDIGIVDRNKLISSTTSKSINGVAIDWNAFDQLTSGSGTTTTGNGYVGSSDSDNQSSESPPPPSFPAIARVALKQKLNGAIQWKNEMILTKATVEKLYSAMTQHLSFKSYGFAFMEDSEIASFVQSHLSRLKTISGRSLCDIGGIDGVIDMVRQIRLHRMQIRCMSGAQKAPKVIKSSSFDVAFGAFNLNWKSVSKDFTETDLKKWVKICNKNEIPPFVLLARWLISNGIVKSFKQLTTFIRSGTTNQNGSIKVLRNASLHRFAVGVSKADGSSFQFEDRVKESANQLEQLGFDALEELLFDHGMHGVSLLTEQQQKREWRKSDKSESLLTPDVLFSDPVQINGQKVKWVDFKNYFVSQRDSFMFKKLKQRCEKYTQRFGSGAIMCRGFEEEAARRVNAMFLDAFCLGL